MQIRISLIVAMTLCGNFAEAGCRSEQVNITSSDFNLSAMLSREAFPSQIVFSIESLNPENSRADQNSATDIEFREFVGEPSDQVDIKSGLVIKLSFLCGVRGASIFEAYSIDYLYLPNHPIGHVYLPGIDDPRYGRNVATMVLGLEGGWYDSTEQWERTIRPVIERVIDRWVEQNERLDQQPPFPLGRKDS